MTAFVDYERIVVRSALQPRFTPEGIETILNDAEFRAIEHTGCGYFLTVRHPELPRARSVFSPAGLLGVSGGTECGFAIFIEAGELTLECFVYSGEIGSDVRERQMAIQAVSIHNAGN